MNADVSGTIEDCNLESISEIKLYELVEGTLNVETAAAATSITNSTFKNVGLIQTSILEFPDLLPITIRDSTIELDSSGFL